MSQGLQIWDAGGALTVDLTTRLTRILGSFNTGLSGGSFSDARLSEGLPFFQITTGGLIGYSNFPTIEISGTTISWFFATLNIPAPDFSSNVIYGVY